MRGRELRKIINHPILRVLITRERRGKEKGERKERGKKERIEKRKEYIIYRVPNPSRDNSVHKERHGNGKCVILKVKMRKEKRKKERIGVYILKMFIK